MCSLGRGYLGYLVVIHILELHSFCKKNIKNYCELSNCGSLLCTPVFYAADPKDTVQ